MTVKWGKYSILPSSAYKNNRLWMDENGKKAYIVSSSSKTKEIPYSEAQKIKNKNLSIKVDDKKENFQLPLDTVFHTVCAAQLKDGTRNMDGHDIKKINQLMNKTYEKENVLFLDEIHWVCIKGKRRLLSTNGSDAKNIFHSLLNKKIEIAILPLSIHSKDVCVMDEKKLEPSSHENSFFIDKKRKRIERFDPNFIDTDYESLQLDAYVEEIAHQMNYEYVSPFDDLPEHGLQCLQGDDSNDCVAWSYAWSEFRIRYPSIPRNELFERFLFTLFSESQKDENIGTLLHNYIKYYMTCLLSHLQ